ncbi:MAG: TolC family protein [Melioribacteraceae bacterium]|nr:MAG: TolC family protein [Melioribacteraceae bacterium]
MKKITFLVSLLMVSSVFAQKQLTLEDAVSIALQRNTSLIKSQNNLSASEAELRSAYGDLLPNLGASGSFDWSRIDDDGGTQVDFLGNVIQTPASSSESRRYSVGLGGGITLFNGMANWANISQKSNNLEAAEFDLTKLKQDIVYQTTEYFYDVINNEEILKVREENVKYNQKLLETIEEKNRLGSVPVVDVYSQQVQLGNAELQLIQAENIYENSKSTLLNYLALDVLDEYTFVNKIALDDQINTDSYMTQFGDMEMLVNEALSNRFDYKSQKLAAESASDGVTIARGGIFPQLTGNYNYGSSATTTSDLFNRRSLSAGLTLSIPIFSNFNVDTRIQSAQIFELNTLEDLSALERQIKIEIKQGYLDLLATKKNLDVTNKNVISARENRRINTERYNLGAGNIVELLQADRDYVSALSNKIDALFGFFTSRDRLLNALGKLDYKVFE